MIPKSPKARRCTYNNPATLWALVSTLSIAQFLVRTLIASPFPYCCLSYPLIYACTLIHFARTLLAARRATGDRFQHDRARVVCIRGGSGDSASIGTEQHHTEKSPIRYVDIFKGYHGFRGSSAWPRRAVAIDGIDTGNSNTNKTRTINSIDGGVQLDGVNRGGAWGRAPEDDVSLGRMLRFILPTLGIWLASPILSLVDAGVVGE